MREGIRRKDDILPIRVLQELLPDGPSKGEIPGKDFELMADEFYQVCGWDINTGIPFREALRRLGLDEIINVTNQAEN